MQDLKGSAQQGTFDVTQRYLCMTILLRGSYTLCLIVQDMLINRTEVRPRPIPVCIEKSAR
jgi:hypothetical protein